MMRPRELKAELARLVMASICKSRRTEFNEIRRLFCKLGSNSQPRTRTGGYLISRLRSMGARDPTHRWRDKRPSTKFDRSSSSNDCQDGAHCADHSHHAES